MTEYVKDNFTQFFLYVPAYFILIFTENADFNNTFCNTWNLQN